MTQVVGKFIPQQMAPEQEVNDFLAALQQGFAPVSKEDLMAQALGLQSWNMGPGVGTTSQSITAGTIYTSGLHLPGGVTASNIVLKPFTAGAGTAPTGIYVGLIDPSGNVRAVSANEAALSGWKATGLVEVPLSAPFTVSNYESGWHQVMFLQVGSWGTTQMSLIRATNWGGVGVNGVLAYGTAGTGQSGLPAVGSSATIVSGGGHIFVGVS